MHRKGDTMRGFLGTLAGFLQVNTVFLHGGNRFPKAGPFDSYELLHGDKVTTREIISVQLQN